MVDESDPDCHSSSCSPLTISDNESVDEMEASGDKVQTKTDKDSEPEGSVPKKNQMVEPSTSSKPRSVYDMLKDVDKKKEGQMKKKYRTRSTEKEDIQEKKSCHQNTGSSRKGSDEVTVGVQEIVPLQHTHQRHIRAKQSDDER